MCCFAWELDVVKTKRVRIIIYQTQHLQSVHGSDGTGSDGHWLGPAAQPRGLTQRPFFSWSGPHLPPPGSNPCRPPDQIRACCFSRARRNSPRHLKTRTWWASVSWAGSDGGHRPRAAAAAKGRLRLPWPRGPGTCLTGTGPRCCDLKFTHS